MKLINLSGQKFGHLLVLETFRKNGRTMCKCICDCGNVHITRKDALKRGVTVSCGCYHSQVSKIVAHNNFYKHGLKRSRIYDIWSGMKKRCFNKNCKDYKNYGGRGIKICEEWLEFKPFYNWAMVNGYKDNLTIDRIDVNGNYEPINCRWVTIQEQQKNKRIA